jgi:hypothetical protein
MGMLARRMGRRGGQPQVSLTALMTSRRNLARQVLADGQQLPLGWQVN